MEDLSDQILAKARMQLSCWLLLLMLLMLLLPVCRFSSSGQAMQRFPRQQEMTLILSAASRESRHPNSSRCSLFLFVVDGARKS